MKKMEVEPHFLVLFAQWLTVYIKLATNAQRSSCL